MLIVIIEKVYQREDVITATQLADHMIRSCPLKTQRRFNNRARSRCAHGCSCLNTNHKAAAAEYDSSETAIIVGESEGEPINMANE